MQIGSFIKDLFAGFQLLNLKNDILRKRSDSIKYSVSFTGLILLFWSHIKWRANGLGLQVKKVEDVVYDLSLRNLVPKGGAAVWLQYNYDLEGRRISLGIRLDDMPRKITNEEVT